MSSFFEGSALPPFVREDKDEEDAVEEDDKLLFRQVEERAEGRLRLTNGAATVDVALASRFPVAGQSKLDPPGEDIEDEEEAEQTKKGSVRKSQKI
jgi:hypothetical protein